MNCSAGAQCGYACVSNFVPIPILLAGCPYVFISHAVISAYGESVDFYSYAAANRGILLS
jgi:hypothetical protein